MRHLSFVGGECCTIVDEEDLLAQGIYGSSRDVSFLSSPTQHIYEADPNSYFPPSVSLFLLVFSAIITVLFFLCLPVSKMPGLQSNGFSGQWPFGSPFFVGTTQHIYTADPSSSIPLMLIE